MKTELLQPAATLIAALISSEAIRAGIRPSTQEMFVDVYRKLEAAMLQIQTEDQAAQQR